MKLFICMLGDCGTLTEDFLAATPRAAPGVSEDRAFLCEIMYALLVVLSSLHTTTAETTKGNNFFGMCIGYAVMSGRLAIQASTHMHTHAHSCTLMHTYTHTHIHTHIHTYTHTHIHTHINTYTQIHVYMHTSTRTHKTQARKRTSAKAQQRTNKHVHTRAY